MKSKYSISASIYWTIILVIVTFNLTAQNAASEEAPDGNSVSFNLTLQHTTVVVSNFSESKKFYLGLLKLKEIETDFLPENQMFVSVGNNLELHVGEVPGVDIKPSNFNHFALVVDDFDGFLAYLKKAGIIYTTLGGGEKYAVQNRPDGVKQTWFQDPDGYWIEINNVK